MKTEDFNKAVEMITKSNSAKVSFNVPVKDNYINVHSILIHECNADLTKKLIESNYSLFMTEKGLSLDKF